MLNQIGWQKIIYQKTNKKKPSQCGYVLRNPQILRVPAGAARNWLQVIASSLSARRKWATNLGVRKEFKQQGGRLHNVQMSLGHVCVMTAFIKEHRICDAALSDVTRAFWLLRLRVFCFFIYLKLTNICLITHPWIRLQRTTITNVK